MKFNVSRKFPVTVTCLLILMFSGCIITTYKLNSRIKSLNTRVFQLENHISSIASEVDNTKRMLSFNRAGKIFSEKCTNNNYNCLAIGNSITKHGKCDYWWGDYGMAASELNKDYFHILDQMFKSGGVNANSYAINFAQWEQLNHDRAQVLPLLDPFLNANINLIVIQLGENVVGVDTYEDDFNELITYLKKRSPKAKIIMIDDFWENKNRLNVKKRVALYNKVSFLDLSEILGKDEYMCGLNTVVMGNNGEKHIVNHKGVAMHPNDRAMQYIAKKIYLEAIILRDR